MIRKLAAEFLGTAILVFLAVGAATLMFGFKFDGGSVAAGVVATALAFGLTLLALVYLIGPVSGSHVNPAVTIGALFTGRISLGEAIGRGRTLAEATTAMQGVAEGVATARSVAELAARHAVEMPLTRAVQDVLFEGVSPAAAIAGLMARPLKAEG